MLSLLSADIAKSEASTASNSKQPSPDSPSLQNKVPDISSFVEHVPDLGIDKQLEQDIMQELSSLNLLNSASRKVKTQWLSPTSDNYEYAAVCNKPKPIDGFPNICKLMSIVNAHPSTTGDSDCCFVTCYSSSKKSLKLHKDNEDLMCQSSSISTVSFGAPRKLEFVRDGKTTAKGKRDLTADISLDASHLTMNVMKPGAQKIMKHRVPKGISHGDNSKIRYSLSFRKIVPQSTSPARSSNVGLKPTPASTMKSLSPDSSSIHKKRAVLIAGDSFTARLDEKRLGKGKMEVVKVAQGGRKIQEVQNDIEKFVAANTQYDIHKVIVSVGTNDIRHCKNGVKHLILRTPYATL